MNIRYRTVLTFTTFALFVFAPHEAGAHIMKSEAVDFLSGIKHPVSGFDHIAAMLAVGLWGAQLGAPAIWMLPIAFPLIMAVGGFLGLIGMPLPGAEIGIALSGMVLGAVIFFKQRWPLPVALTLIGAFAICHGYAHGAELPQGANGLLYSLGFVVATGLLHATGIVIGLLNRWRWGSLIVQGSGALIFFVGLFFLKDCFL